VTTPLVIEAHQVWKSFRLYHVKHPELKTAVLRGYRGRYDEFWALQRIDLRVEAGQSLGIIGQNGSGKSTFLKLIARILAPSRGTIAVRGKVATLLELGAGFQPDYSGLENIHLNGAILGLTRSQIRERLAAIVEFAELERFIDNPIRTYSSGMYMRLGFAIAVHVDADILLVDEVLAVGDEAFQKKCLERIQALRREGRTLVFVSHDLGAVAEVCDRVIWLDQGSIEADGPPQHAIDSYLDQVGARRTASEVAEPTAGGPARVHAVRFCDGQARTAHQFQTGEPFSVEIDFEFRERVADPFFGVAIFRNDGVYCYGSNTRVDGIPVDGGPRRGTVRLSCPALPLLTGTYEVSIGVFDGMERPLVFQERAHRIRVDSDRPDHGVMLIPHQWSVSG
jgi:ABC-type polysaccharide/polyol phosphate transport system ATPase subunit